ncbi:MAG: hypothetical protein N3G19_01760 [Candidatus Pacearchaeota archaeon]|nr:hypothetical protein [Candidatus Pacearchaeota archaeon]
MPLTKDELLQQLRAQPSEAKKQEYLEAVLKKPQSTEVKISALVALAELFVNKKWFALAARNYCYAADLASTFREKMDLYFKGAVLYLQASDYLAAEDNFRKVLVLAANKDRDSLKQKILALYLNQATNFEKSRQLTKAIAAYNRILMMKLPFEKINEIRLKLIELYEKIGKPIEANQIRAQIRRDVEQLEVEKSRAKEEPTAQEFL